MERLIRAGDHSDEVSDVQSRLRALGFPIDDPHGTFGPSTAAAIRAFQQKRFLLVDGVVGPQTWNALVEASWRLGDRTLYLKNPYMRGDDVSTLQQRMNALGFDAGREDGIYGPLAYRSVRAFQKEYGLPEDGMYGPTTHAALSGLRVDRPGISARIREQMRHRHGRGLQGETIVIDPGHGGEDLGDLGPNGTSEAEVCWKLATLVAERLVGYGASVRFTRQEPEDPTDGERAAFANGLGADLVISLHLNSNQEETAEGSSAYHFPTSAAGEELADALQNALVKFGCRDCRTHPRSYTILRETRAPAVVLEPAFITNPDEEKRLEDPEHLAALADAIVSGIQEYASVSKR